MGVSPRTGGQCFVHHASESLIVATNENENGLEREG